MNTIRIYRDDRYASSCETEVTSVLEKDGFDLIACRESVFYPEGGGQPSDIGNVSLGDRLFEISHASDESFDSDVWHLTDAPFGTFSVGDKVSLTIDFDYRFKNMQRHLGEHMLSGTMDSLFGGVNKGFHIGDDYVTIDIDLEGRMLTDDELDLAEHTVNEAIWADLPVTVEYFDTYEESLARPVRKKVPHDGIVSVVSVGDLNDPYDCIACCGVHPARSSEVGLLAIYKNEANKGMNRIFFDCGANALARLKKEFNILQSVARERSCASQDLPSRLEAEAESTAALRARMTEMTDYIKLAEKEKILEDIKISGTSVHTYFSDILIPDELLKLGFDVVQEASGLLLILVNPSSNTCLLLSSREDAKCGQLVKEHAAKHNGKGGGRDDNARALFESAADMNAFIEDIKSIV